MFLLFGVVFIPGGGAVKTYAYKAAGPRNLWQPKISLQLHCNPKISPHFILTNPKTNIKDLETMQIAVRITSKELRSISFLLFGAFKIS